MREEKKRNAAAVGVIGGADGPTAVFVSLRGGERFGRAIREAAASLRQGGAQVRLWRWPGGAALVLRENGKKRCLRFSKKQYRENERRNQKTREEMRRLLEVELPSVTPQPDPQGAMCRMLEELGGERTRDESDLACAALSFLCEKDIAAGREDALEQARKLGYEPLVYRWQGRTVCLREGEISLSGPVLTAEKLPQEREKASEEASLANQCLCEKLTLARGLSAQELEAAKRGEPQASALAANYLWLRQKMEEDADGHCAGPRA